MQITDQWLALGDAHSDGSIVRGPTHLLQQSKIRQAQSQQIVSVEHHQEAYCQRASIYELLSCYNLNIQAKPSNS